MTENCYIQYLQNKLYTCCVIILHSVPVHKIFTRYLFFNSMLSKEAPKHVEHRQYIFSLSILLLFTYFCFFFQYPQNEEIECLSWTQPKERWCHVAKWHNGSRECVCNGLSSYVLNLTATHSELEIPSILQDKNTFFAISQKMAKESILQLKRRFKFFDRNRTLFFVRFRSQCNGQRCSNGPQG